MSVTESDTVTDTFHFGQGLDGKPYIAGVYQLVGDYQMIPGDNIQDLQDDFSNLGQLLRLGLSLPNNVFKDMQVTAPYNYSADVYGLVEVAKQD